MTSRAIASVTLALFVGCAGSSAAPAPRPPTNEAAASAASSTTAPSAAAIATTVTAASAASASATATPDEPRPLSPPTWGAGVKYAPTRQSTLPAPPGPCVEPKGDAARRLKWKHPAEPLDPLQPIDLDGDGVSDLIFDVGDVDISSNVFVYVMRGPCGHFVGYFFNDHTPFEVDEGASHGLANLVGWKASRTGPARRWRTTYRFDGVAYREAETVDCASSSCDASAP